MANPLQGMCNFYSDCVKEADEKGYSDVFKECTKIFFKTIKKKCNVKIEHIKYLDGYFIFGYGTNSVVHFKIKECPGWLFGIWWDRPADEETDGEGNKIKRDFINCIDGQLFAQYEEIIDKFKPSASTFVSTFSISIASKMNPYLFHEVNTINFIKNEPELAFCRDYKGWDYNEEYHTREAARKVYAKYRKWQDDKDKYEKIFEDKLLKFYKDNVLKLYKGSKIVDRGSNWSPRYDVVAPIDKNKEFDDTGYYDIFEDREELKKKYDKLVSECESISDKYDFWWYNPVDTCVYIYNKKEEVKND